MEKFEEEFNYLIELSGKVLTGQIEAEKFEKQRAIFLKEYSEKQKPEIPEFVADEIEEKNRRFSDFHKTANIEGYVKDVRDWYYEKPYHAELFYRAILDGYTVAKEKRYEVVFLEDDTTRQILMENNAGYYFIEEESENYGYWKQDFTEMEIKEINEKFWQLSVPVKDEQIEVEE